MEFGGYRLSLIFLIFLLSFVFFIQTATAAPVLEEHKNFTNSSASAGPFTLPSISGGTNQLYIIVITVWSSNASTDGTPFTQNITGGGLTWDYINGTRGCGARIASLNDEMWWAFGNPSAFQATVNLKRATGAPGTTITIHRISGAANAEPKNGAYQNTNGLNGACSGGVDTTKANVTITANASDEMVFVYIHPRISAESGVTQDPDFIKVNFTALVSGGDGANQGTYYNITTGAGDVLADFELTTARDWVMGGAVIAPSGWWNNSFSKCRNITISNVGSTTLTDFPAYVNVTYDADMQTDFDDLRFVSQGCNNGGTPLNYEIENYTSSNADIWIKIPSLPTSGTTISMYYGNSTVSSGENATGVWDSTQYDWKGVWHLVEDAAGTGATDLYNDSTSNANHGDDFVNNSTNTKYGRIDGGQDFDGSNDYIAVPTSPSINLTNNTITIEAWVKLKNAFTSSSPQDMTIIDGGGKIEYWFDAGTGNVTFSLFTGGWLALTSNQNSWTAGVWYHLVGTYNGSNRYLYVNGKLDNSIADTGNLAADSFGIWMSQDNVGTNEGPFNGTIDEVRLLNSTVSADWVNQSYQIVANQSTYVTVGTEENKPAVLPKWSSNVTSPSEPANYSQGQSYQFNVTWTDADSTVSVVLIQQNFTTLNSTVVNQTMSNRSTEYYFNVSDLPAGTYVWRSYANDTDNNWNSTPQWTYTVNKASSNVTIISPTNGTSFYRGNSVSLQSTIKNQTGAPISNATVKWYNSTTNILSVENGSWVIPAGHTLGNHIITVNATHTNYTTGSATANITINNALPQLTTPTYNVTPAEVLAGDSIRISCDVTDYETAVGSLTVNISVKDASNVWSNVTVTDRTGNTFHRNYSTASDSPIGTYTSICDALDTDSSFNQSSTSTFTVYQNGTIEINMNATKAGWGEPINISITAKRSNSSTIANGNTTIKVGSRQKCSGTTDSNGKYSCIFNAPNSIGRYTVRVEVTDPSTSKVITNTTTLDISVSIGSSEAEQLEAGNVGCVDTPRLFQNPDGTIKTVFVRICVWR